jgi:serine/alanine adding enzyme
MTLSDWRGGKEEHGGCALNRYAESLQTVRVRIKLADLSDTAAWDRYVKGHPMRTVYHLSGWQTVISRTYGHRAYYLMAIRDAVNGKAAGAVRGSEGDAAQTRTLASMDGGSVCGVLPLIQLKLFPFYNALISIPYFDTGGTLADDGATEAELLNAAIELGIKCRASYIELRNTEPLSCLNESDIRAGEFRSASERHNVSHGRVGIHRPFLEADRSGKCSEPNWVSLPVANRGHGIVFGTRAHKIRMMLELPDSSETLMKSFKSKLRSQIRRPLREGLKARIGGRELLDDFYRVFCIHMRDLGSPVHREGLMVSVLAEFHDDAKIVVIYKESEPVAASLVIGFNETLENPWASALKKFSSLSPNMLLYWSMLEYACDNGFKYFDFGRSSPDEGTHKFKEQWGALPVPLQWQCISLKGKSLGPPISEDRSFQLASEIWKHLPVSVSRIIGPRIRKHIGL